jgi:DNA polymerase-3 subunit gamma/tau
VSELYKKYRPKTLKQMVGQDLAVKALQKMLEAGTVPHTLLFSGPSGCGKTTLARILKKALECSNEDFVEINCADFRGVDMVREIRQRMSLHPMLGKVRIWLIDEAHQLTKDAQNALLKMLEDTPAHVYFMLATTDPNKLANTIRTRSMEVRVLSLPPKVCIALLQKICAAESVQVSEEVLERIAEYSEGSARKALVLLGQVIALDDDEERLQAVLSNETKQQAIELARALINPRGKWADVAKLLKAIDEDPESLRYMVLGYASSVLLGGGALAARAYLVVTAFRDNFYDSKKAGLVAACFEVMR